MHRLVRPIADAGRIVIAQWEVPHTGKALPLRFNIAVEDRGELLARNGVVRAEAALGIAGNDAGRSCPAHGLAVPRALVRIGVAHGIVDDGTARETPENGDDLAARRCAVRRKFALGHAGHKTVFIDVLHRVRVPRGIRDIGERQRRIAHNDKGTQVRCFHADKERIVFLYALAARALRCTVVAEDKDTAGVTRAEPLAVHGNVDQQCLAAEGRDRLAVDHQRDLNDGGTVKILMSELVRNLFGPFLCDLELQLGAAVLRQFTKYLGAQADARLIGFDNKLHTLLRRVRCGRLRQRDGDAVHLALDLRRDGHGVLAGLLRRADRLTQVLVGDGRACYAVFDGSGRRDRRADRLDIPLTGIGIKRPVVGVVPHDAVAVFDRIARQPDIRQIAVHLVEPTGVFAVVKFTQRFPVLADGPNVTAFCTDLGHTGLVKRLNKRVIDRCSLARNGDGAVEPVTAVRLDRHADGDLRADRRLGFFNLAASGCTARLDQIGTEIVYIERHVFKMRQCRQCAERLFGGQRVILAGVAELICPGIDVGQHSVHHTGAGDGGQGCGVFAQSQ